MRDENLHNDSGYIPSAAKIVLAFIATFVLALPLTIVLLDQKPEVRAQAQMKEAGVHGATRVEESEAHPIDQPMPSIITPTIYCLGACQADPSNP